MKMDNKYISLAVLMQISDLASTQYLLDVATNNLSACNRKRMNCKDSNGKMSPVLNIVYVDVVHRRYNSFVENAFKNKNKNIARGKWLKQTVSLTMNSIFTPNAADSFA